MTHSRFEPTDDARTAAARFRATDRSWEERARAPLGAALAAARRHPEAEAAFRAVVALDPTASRTWNDLANVVRKQDRDREGVEVYRRALALAPGEGRVLAAALVDLDRPEEALEAVASIPTGHPDQAAALCHAAAARMLCAQPQAAADPDRVAAALAQRVAGA